MFNFLKKQKKEPENLDQLLSEFKKIKQDFEDLSSAFRELKEESRFSVQKVGIIRFNPFSQIGGNQSFSIALLDRNDNGIIITSFYARENNRVYAKPIKGGKSQYNLSKEEVRAIELAIKNYNKNEKRESENNNQAADSCGSGSY